MNREKAGLLVLVGLIILISIPVVILRFVAGGGEDSWICANGQWVKHGNPSAPTPVSGCGEAIPTEIMVNAMGNLIKDNPGFKAGVWYLVSEKPGPPAVTTELSFNGKSSCTINGKVSICDQSNFVVGQRVIIDGVQKENVVSVVSLIDESSSKALSSCPKWVNCMPGPDVNVRCVVPPGCENITQKAY